MPRTKIQDENLGRKMPYLGVLSNSFEKLLSYSALMSEIRLLEFVLLQTLVQKQISLNMGPKMPDLGIFLLELENNFVDFEIIALEFS